MAGSSMQTIEEDYANMSLHDEGDEGDEGLILEEANVEIATTDLPFCLVGSFLTNRKINFQAMQDTLSSIWRPVKGVYMEETNIPNLFMFKFFHELDVQRVLNDGPWTFNNQALMVKRLELGERLSDIKLSELYIWVQVYELPVGFNSEFILKSIGNYIGNYIQSDPKNFQSIWRQCLRIKVALNVFKPLKSQMRIKKSGGDWMWIKFKYERLPSFCFYCGIIGHSEKFCEALFDKPGEKESRRYDASLRAAVKNQSSIRKNQWLRSSDGGKQDAGRKEVNVEMGEREKIDQTEISVTKSQDFRVMQLVGREIGGELRDSVNKGYDNVNSNEGVVF